MSGLVKRKDYCQFLLSSQINYTLTYFADHTTRFSHDAPTRYLRRDRITSKQIWQQAKRDLSKNGFIVFDDSVLDKNHSRHIELVYKQYSGNEHRVINGIGFISCVYVNPETGEFWEIDYRVYDPNTDGKSKHQHVADMLENCFLKCSVGELEFKTVLMDTWYATTKLMLLIHRSKRIFYCPIQSNRKVSQKYGTEKYQYQSANSLDWTEQEENFGKRPGPEGAAVGPRRGQAPLAVRPLLGCRFDQDGCRSVQDASWPHGVPFSSRRKYMLKSSQQDLK